MAYHGMCLDLKVLVNYSLFTTHTFKIVFYNISVVVDLQSYCKC